MAILNSAKITLFHFKTTASVRRFLNNLFLLSMFSLSPATVSNCEANSLLNWALSFFHLSPPPSNHVDSPHNSNPAPNPTNDPYHTLRFHTSGRVVAIGDLHGDATAMRKALK